MPAGHMCSNIHCPKYLATFRDIEGNVTAKKLYTQEQFEIGVPIYALKLQLTDLGTFRDTPHATPSLRSLRISRNISRYLILDIKFMLPVRLELGPDDPQAGTLTTRLPFLDTIAYTDLISPPPPHNTAPISRNVSRYLISLPSTQQSTYISKCLEILQQKMNHEKLHYMCRNQ